jgi:hypothetical protein
MKLTLWDRVLMILSLVIIAAVVALHLTGVTQ